MLQCDRHIGIPDGDHVWRRVKNGKYTVVYDGNENRIKVRIEKPTEKNVQYNPPIQFDPDVSVNWVEHLQLHGKSHLDLTEDPKEAPLIFQAKVCDLRALRPLGEDKRVHVVYTPNSSIPIDCSHSSILPMGFHADKNADKILVREALQNVLFLVHGTPVEGIIPEGA